MVKKVKGWFGGNKKKTGKGDAKKIKDENKKDKAEELDAKDKKKHKEIGGKIKKSLQKTEGKDIVDLQKKADKKAEELEDKYQPQLKKGINLDVKVESAQKAKKDGDVDISINIKPNNFFIKFGLDSEEEEAQFSRLLYKAIQIIAEDQYKGYSKEEYSNTEVYDKQKKKIEKEVKEFSGGSKPQSKRKKTGESHSESTSQVVEDEKTIKELKESQEKEKKIEKMANQTHKALAKIQIAYSSASMAKYYPNNVFGAFSSKFFVDQAFNYYIYSNNTVEDGLYYKKGDKEKGYTKEEIKQNNGSYLIGPSNKSVRHSADYNKSKLKISDLENALFSIGQNGHPNLYDIELTLFLAAMVAEPSRYRVAHITNLLAINNPDGQDEKPYTKDGVLPMSQGGSDPSDVEGKGKKVDKRLDHGDKKTPKRVTDKDLKSVKNNESLRKDLLTLYKNTKNKESVVPKFIQAIKDFLDIE